MAGLALVPWRRLPSDAQVLPALAYLVAVALLRDAAGGVRSGLGALVLIPVIWLALYGSRRQLIVIIAGVVVVWALPILVVRGADYPATGWRACLLFVALSAVIGVTVQVS